MPPSLSNLALVGVKDRPVGSRPASTPLSMRLFSSSHQLVLHHRNHCQLCTRHVLIVGVLMNINGQVNVRCVKHILQIQIAPQIDYNAPHINEKDAVQFRGSRLDPRLGSRRLSARLVSYLSSTATVIMRQVRFTRQCRPRRD
jgi:hypothetical protein